MTPQGIGKLMDGVASQMETAVNGLRRTYKDVVRYELGYETQGLHKSVTEAHRAVQWFVNDVVHRETALKRWVSLMGASGCGKSHLAAAAVRVLREQNRQMGGFVTQCTKALGDMAASCRAMADQLASATGQIAAVQQQMRNVNVSVRATARGAV